MSDDFLLDEISVEDSEPRELYQIVQSAAVTYRIASGDRDIVYDGHTYAADPVARTEVGISTSSGEFQVTLTLPLKHALCQRYLALGSPPRQIQVTMWRKQLRSGLVEQIWFGYITSLAFDSKDQIGKFVVPSRMNRAFGRYVPSLTVNQLCPHQLYDAQCQASAGSFSVTTTVASHDGRRVVVASVSPFNDGLNTMFPQGDLTHVATGEVQTIFAQTDDVKLDLQAVIPDLKDGDMVIIRGGCAHDVITCHDKFNNMLNYGGQPQLPMVDLFLPGNFGFGVFTQV